jgi:hypothetical protein
MSRLKSTARLLASAICLLGITLYQHDALFLNLESGHFYLLREKFTFDLTV